MSFINLSTVEPFEIGSLRPPTENDRDAVLDVMAKGVTAAEQLEGCLKTS
jgi:hypothetical protein